MCISFSGNASSALGNLGNRRSKLSLRCMITFCCDKLYRGSRNSIEIWQLSAIECLYLAYHIASFSTIRTIMSNRNAHVLIGGDFTRCCSHA